MSNTTTPTPFSPGYYYPTPEELAQQFFSFTFHFVPTNAASIAPLAWFGVMTLLMLALNLRFGGGKFMYILVVSAAMEVAGYGARLYISLRTDQIQSLTPYMIYALFVLLPPIFLALVNYFVVGRLLTIINKPVRMVFTLQPHHIAKVFLSSDIITLIIQSTGAGMLAIQNASANKAGMGIALAGLAIQLVFFVGFIWICFYIRFTSSYWTPLSAKLPTITRIYIGLFWTIAMLLIRNIYRLAEFSMVSEDFLHPYLEWIFFTFDSVLIFLAFVGYAVFHFGLLLQAEIPDEPEKSSTELKQPA